MPSVATLKRSGTTVETLTFSYYGVSYGNPGQLETAVVADSAGNILDQYYYRYYTPNDSDINGYVGGLKYVFDKASTAAAVRRGGRSDGGF